MSRDSIASMAAEIDRLAGGLKDARAEEYELIQRLAILDRERAVLTARLATANEELSDLAERCGTAAAVLRPGFTIPLSLKRELVRRIFSDAPLNEQHVWLIERARTISHPEINAPLEGQGAGGLDTRPNYAGGRPLIGGQVAPT
jgi:hypothetical protein